MDYYKCGGKMMNNGGYIPSYAYGGMPQYGFGSWLKSNAGAVGTVTGGVLGTTAGIFLGNPILGAQLGTSIGGSIGGSVQQNYEHKQAQQQSSDFQRDQLLMTQNQQAKYMKMQNQNNLIQSRLSGLNNSQPQYGSVFKNGGKMGNRLMPSYNQNFPQTTATGDTIYITPTTTKTLSDTSTFKPVNDFYSYYTDKKLIPEYGNVQPIQEVNDGKMVFRSDSKGDTKDMEKLFKGTYIPSYGAGGSINIKPSKRGTFTAQATKMGMGVQEAASKILSAPEGRYTPGMRKKANFARNAKSWNKAYGGELDTINNPNVTAIDNGGSHEMNSMGGVPISNRGLLEEGEVIAKINGQDYVFSNRLIAS